MNTLKGKKEDGFVLGIGLCQRDKSLELDPMEFYVKSGVLSWGKEERKVRICLAVIFPASILSNVS